MTTAPHTAPHTDPMHRWQRAAFWLLFILHVLISFHGLTERFLAGHHGWAGSMRGIIARNYVVHGLRETGLRPYKHDAPRDDLEGAPVHWHHPPGVNLLAAASVAVFGESEAAVRLPTVLCTILSFLLLFVIVRRRHGPGAALLSVAVFALLPMQVEYGKLVNYEVPIVTLTLAALDLLERQRLAPPGARPRRALLLAGSSALLVLAGGLGWFAFFMAFALGVDALIRRPRQPLFFVAIGVSTALTLGLLFLWLGASAGGLGELADLAAWRSGSEGSSTSVGALLDVTLERLVDYYGWLPLLTTLGWLVASDIRRRLDPVILVCGAGNILSILAFKQGATVHNFYIYPLTPAIAVACGLGVVYGARWIAGKGATRRDRRRWIVGAAIVAWVAVFAATVVPTLPPTHRRSYQIRPPAQPSRGFPRDGFLNRSLMGAKIRAWTRPDDLVVFHRSLRPSIQWRYYMHRRYRRIRGTTPPPGARLFVATERGLSKPDQRRLARRYAVTRTMGYLVYDLETPGPKATQLDFVTSPQPPLRWYLESSLYPGYELRENPDAARDYLTRLETYRTPSR